MRGSTVLKSVAVLFALTACDRGPELAAEHHGVRHAVAAIDDAQKQDPPVVSLDEGVIDAEPVANTAPDGYVRMTPIARRSSFGNAVFLIDANDEVVVPIYIGGTEALSIQLRLAGRKYARPLTHDLFDAFARRAGAEMVRAQVDRLENSVYIGAVIFKKGDELIKLDARPSDAIALAVGNAVPIFVSQKLLDEVGVRTDQLDDHKPKTTDPVAL